MQKQPVLFSLISAALCVWTYRWHFEGKRKQSGKKFNYLWWADGFSKRGCWDRDTIMQISWAVNGHRYHPLTVPMVFISYNIYSARGIYCTLYIKRKVAHGLSNLQSSLAIYSVQYMWTLSNTMFYASEHILSDTLHWLSTAVGFRCIPSPDILADFIHILLGIFLFFLRQILHSMFMAYSCQTFLHLCKNFSW